MDTSDTTYIFCAMKTEAKPFVEVLEDAEVKKRGRVLIHTGSIDGHQIVLACNAVGPVKAAAAASLLIEDYGATNLIVSGTAGGIDNSLEIGDTVVATETVYHDRDNAEVYLSDAKLLERCRVNLEQQPPGHPVCFGRIATGKDFLKQSMRAPIIERLNPLCVEMESAAIAEVCQKFDVPYLAVRTVSDTEAKSGLVVFFKNALLAARHSFAVVRILLG